EDFLTTDCKIKKAKLFLVGEDTMFCLPEVRHLVYKIEDSVLDYFKLNDTAFVFMVYSSKKVYINGLTYSSFFLDFDSVFILFFDKRKYMDKQKEYVQMNYINRRGQIVNRTAFVEKKKKYKYLKKISCYR